MKKLMTMILCFTFLSISSTIVGKTYLVELGTTGAATWRATGVGDTLVNLSTAGTGGISVSLNEWFTDKSLATPLFSGTKFAPDDQVWIINGTYYLTATINLFDGIAIYGGFAGTETTTDGATGRTKVSGGNAWDFKNATILDGSVAGTPRVPTYICISSGAIAATLTTLIDGLTIQNGSNATTNGAAGGAKINGSKTTMQNCIITSCIGWIGANGGASGVMLMGGGTVQDCYIHHNTGNTGVAGGISISGINCNVSRCTIANNTAGSSAGLYLYATTGGVSITSCNFTSNTATTGNGSGMGGYINAGVQEPINISNCSFTSNTSSASGGALYINFSVTPSNKVNVTGCTFTSNNANTALGSSVGGGAVILNSGVFLVDKCIFTNNHSTASNGGAIVANSNAITISNSTFIGNTSAANGSAIYCVKSTTINNCVVAGNTGTTAIYVYASAGVSGTFNNVTVASNLNVAGTPVGINLNAALVASTFTNCLFYNCNTSPIKFTGSFPPVVTYTGFDTDVSVPAFATTGCINTITAESFVDAANNNYHLVAGSKAVDAGYTVVACSPDIDNVARPQGAAYDMGAYEYFTPNAVYSILQEESGIKIIDNAIIPQYNGTIEVFNLLGKQLITSSVVSGQNIKLGTGIYIVRLKTIQGISVCKVSL